MLRIITRFQRPDPTVRLLVGAAALSGLLWLTALTACGGKGAQTVQLHEDRVPSKLSQWGLITRRGDRLQLGAGVVEYQLNSALFSDYAHKLRTIWMPEGVHASAPTKAGGVFDLPVGTILSKTFYYPLDDRGQVVPDRTGNGAAVVPEDLSSVRLVETRLLVHRDTGWIALPYVWNATQSDAELTMVGDRFEFALASDLGDDPDSFPYYVPDVNQCGGCHTTEHGTRALQPIGPKPRHLDRASSRTAFAHDGSSEVQAHPEINQLQQWQQTDLLDRAFDRTTEQPTADWTDASIPLESRVRAYLDINCSHCHSSTGPADTSGLLLTPGSRIEDLGVCKPPIAAGRGTGNRRVGVAPGAPEDSILIYRMSSTDPGVAMPELGRSLSHDEGVELIRQWIAQMDGDCGTERFGRALRQSTAQSGAG